MMDSALFDAMVLHIRNGASQTRAGTDKLRKHVDALIADRDALRELVAALDKQVAGQKALVEMTRHSGDSAREREYALRAALEAAPKPRKQRFAGIWHEPASEYVVWYESQRQAALALDQEP